MMHTDRDAARISTLRFLPGRGAALLACATIPLIACTGCFVASFAQAEAKVEVLTGTDSAGATVEITRHKGTPTKARVSDIVLGEGEAEVTQTAGHLTFTITFPAGVAITYTAETVGSAGAVPDLIEGVWVQHAAGVFGEDTGNWTVTRAAFAEER